MFSQSNLSRCIGTVLLLASLGLSANARADETQALEELRNTVINLIEGLVQKGVLTREQAQVMVQTAQDKAAAQAKAKTDQEIAEKDAVRVTYVPETVRKQISAEVSAELEPQVTKAVVEQAKAEKWGVPGALPDWVNDLKFYGDVRVRAEGDLFADGNVERTYYDFNRVNAAGGIGEAGDSAFLNVSENRYRLVGRARIGVAAKLGNSMSLDVRLATGNALTPNSTNQTMGTYGARWAINVDRAAILWNPTSASHNQQLDFRFGRFANPFVSLSELVWDVDLGFEGISLGYAADVFGSNEGKIRRDVFVTVGAFPLQEVELSDKDKWLFGGQLGMDLPVMSNLNVHFAAGYFDYKNIVGQRNSSDSAVLDYTAPRYLQKGNTLFDIRNDIPASTNLFALASDYQLANASLWLDFGFGVTHLSIGGEYVRNVGWDSEAVLARTGQFVEAQTDGYDVGIIVGYPQIAAGGQWRAGLSYRYLEADATLDAFTDSDFRLGGTDMKGYQLSLDLGLSAGSWLRARYITADQIIGPALGIDVVQLDLNGRF